MTMDSSLSEADASARTKVSACVQCRSIKAKCEPIDGSSQCQRCTRRGDICERAAVQKSGRPRGSRNHISALDKALQVIEREVGRSNKRTRQSSDDDRPTSSRAGSIDTRLANVDQVVAADFTFTTPSSLSILPVTVPTSRDMVPLAPTLFPSSTLSSTIPQPTSASFQAYPPPSSLSAHFPGDPHTSYTISPHSLTSLGGDRTDNEGDADEEGIFNPVRLLAEAAEEAPAEDRPWGVHAVPPRAPIAPLANLPPQYHLSSTLHAMILEGPIHPDTSTVQDTHWLAQGLEQLLEEGALRTLTEGDKRFFKPTGCHVKRDLGPDYDPLALALVTPMEIKAFFAAFFARLHPLLPVLDPALHTVDFVQSRSAFLLTAICAHGAALTVGAEEATKRLRLHAQRLSELVSRRSFASVEIVQAFLIWISWLPSSHPFQEERLWHETKFAINMAVELEISKPVRSIGSDMMQDASLAACLESIPTNDQRTIGLIVRNRQRLWLHLFPTRFSQDHLTRDETWCFDPLATVYDPITTAYVTLRRRLVALSEQLRSEIPSRLKSDADWVTKTVDEVLNAWHADWSPQCESSAYLKLIFRHTRLWSLSYALQAITSRGGSIQSLRRDCFASAFSTCQFVSEQLRQGTSLCDFPNTMGPMVSFEALLAVRFSPSIHEGNTATRARVLGLLAHLSILLERVGTSPPHRLGTAAVYGRHLQVYIRRQIVDLCLVHDQQHTGRLYGQVSSTDLVSETAATADFTIDQFFSSKRASPIDQAQAAMTLDWDSANTINFLDTNTCWTDEFFRILGHQQ